MFPLSLCRTCDAHNASSLTELTTHTEKYPEKRISDLLMELAIIDLKMEGIQKLPQELCDTCTRKLNNAYDFIVQARQNQQKLLAHLMPSTTTKETVISNRDCLQEVPINTFDEVIVKEEQEEFSDVEFKYERNMDADDNIGMANKSFDPLSKLEQSLENSSSEDEMDNIPLQQSMILLKEASEPIKHKKKSLERKYKCDKCDKAYLWPQNLRNHKRTHILKKDLLTCPHCSQQFSRKDSYASHLKKHGEQNTNKRPANLCEKKQAKDVDINMCKPNGCKMIQCMLCLGKYNKFSELRLHMRDHQQNVSFTDRRDQLREIAESFYPDIKNLSEDELIERIYEDLRAEKYSLFYSITNDSGYELSLDSSETESDFDADADDVSTVMKKTAQISTSYACELCKASYRRKYELYEHQRHQHVWLDAPWVCVRCDARFVSEQLLQHHYKSLCKNSRKRFACSKCPLRFRWRHNIKSHYRVHQVKNQTYECTECDRAYDDKKSYSIHMLKIHTDQANIMPCHWCNRKFYRRDYLLKHLKRHGLKEQDLPLAEAHIAATSKANGMKSIKCKICNIDFDRIVDLRGHLMMELKLALSVHHSYDSMLNYSITNEYGFELHIDDSETDEDETSYAACQPKSRGVYTCELCKVQCRRKFEMMQHQRTMHHFETLPFACEACIFKTASKDLFEYHKNTQCSNTEKQYLCDVCGYKFMWPENLETHKQLQHLDKMGSLPSAQTNANNSNSKNKTDSPDTPNTAATLPTLQCPHCDRTYMLQSRLNNHIRDVHVEGNRKKKEAQNKFLCSLCGKELHSASYLETHMRRHLGEKPFKCDLCEMTFARQSDVRCHRRKHTGEKPFHCTICGKDFARSDKLKRHMLTHSGLKPYKCTYCEKCYRQSKDLAIHMQQHTGQCPFACGTCGERFLQNKTLEKHRMMRGHFDKAE